MPLSGHLEAGMKRDIQVIEIGHGFAVRRIGDLRLVSVHASQLEAEHAALRLAWEEGVEVVSTLPGGRQTRLRPAAPIHAVARTAKRRARAKPASRQAWRPAAPRSVCPRPKTPPSPDLA